MKLILFSLCALSAALLPSCTDSEASPVAARSPENGAQFKKGEGLSLTEEMTRAIGLKTADVEEQKIASRLEVTLQPLAGTNEASGWLTAEQVAKIQTGAVVEISGTQKITGKVKSVAEAASVLMGHEIVVTADAPFADAGEVQAVIGLPETEAAASIPRSALLSTAEGYFVYTANGKFFVRTPVKTGAMNEDHVEITEGLYAGDEVVTTPVMSLWMAELQVLRGGKACTCGH